MKRLQIVMTGLLSLGAVMLLADTEALAWPQARSCVADLNRDRSVDLTDLSLVVGEQGKQDTRADLNCDGGVDDNDVAIVHAFYGGCYTCKGDVDGDGHVSRRDLARTRKLFGGPGPEADFNQNGVVDLSDLSIVLARQRKVCRQVKRCALPDFDRDGTVGLSDLAKILAAIGRRGLTPLDINRDEVVDGRDVEYVRAFFGAHR